MFSRKKFGPLISHNCENTGLRLFLLFGVFAMTMAAFWWHFERRLAAIEPKTTSYTTHAIVDSGKHLTLNEKKALVQWRDAFQQTWGVPLFLQVSPESLDVPTFSNETLFIGVGLQHKDAVIILPSLVRKALGEGVRVHTEEKLAQCMKEHAPGMCLATSLQDLWDAFER